MFLCVKKKKLELHPTGLQEEKKRIRFFVKPETVVIETGYCNLVSTSKKLFQIQRCYLILSVLLN